MTTTIEASGPTDGQFQPDYVALSAPHAPMYNADDSRWAELEAWLAINRGADGAFVTMDGLDPADRAVWHALHVLNNRPVR